MDTVVFVFGFAAGAITGGVRLAPRTSSAFSGRPMKRRKGDEPSGGLNWYIGGIFCGARSMTSQL